MINIDSVQYNFFNGQNMNIVTAFLIWGYLGLISSILIDIVRNKEKIKRTGGFNFPYWIKDNAARTATSMIVILLGCLFSEDLLGIKGNLGAFGAGFMTDKIIEALIKFRSNVNLSLFTKNKNS